MQITDQNKQEEKISNKNESQRFASDDQGSQSTDNHVQIESERGNARNDLELTMNKSRSHQEKVAKTLVKSQDKNSMA